MPGLIDKVLLNFRTVKGYYRLMRQLFKSNKMLGLEIQEKGLLKEAEPIKDKLKTGCEDFDAACEKFVAVLLEVQAESAALIDKNLP